MNEFLFTCTTCGQLSDDGDILNEVCMSCDDKKAFQRGMGEFQRKQIEQTELLLNNIRKIKESLPTATAKDIAAMMGFTEGYIRRLIKRL